MPSMMSCSVRAESPRRPRRVPASAAAPQVLHRLDPELAIDLADGLGAKTGEPQQLDEAGRHLRREPIVERQVPGRRELGDLVADRGADARDAWRGPRSVRGDEVDGTPSDRVGRPVVRDGLEDELALDLQHVADVMEDPREIAVRQVAGRRGFVVVLADRGSRHRL